MKKATNCGIKYFLFQGKMCRFCFFYNLSKPEVAAIKQKIVQSVISQLLGEGSKALNAYLKQLVGEEKVPEKSIKTID